MVLGFVCLFVCFSLNFLYNLVYWLPIRKERYRCEISGFGTLLVAVSFCWFFTKITISSDLLPENKAMPATCSMLQGICFFSDTAMIGYLIPLSLSYYFSTPWQMTDVMNLLLFTETGALPCVM